MASKNRLKNEINNSEICISEVGRWTLAHTNNEQVGSGVGVRGFEDGD